MPPVLAYETAQMQVNRDADGTLRIELPAIGVGAAMRRTLWRSKSATGNVIGMIFAGMGLVGPPAIAFVIWRLKGDGGALAFFIAAPFVEAFVVAILLGLFAYRGKEEAHIAISPTMFSIEQSGIGDTERLMVGRELVEAVYVEVEYREAMSQWLRVRCRGEKEGRKFLGHLSEEELREIAGVIQRELGLRIRAKADECS